MSLIGISMDVEHLKYVKRKRAYQVQITIPKPLRAIVAELTATPERTLLTRYTGITGDPPARDKRGKPIWPVAAKRAALPIIAEFNGVLESAKAGLPVVVFDLRHPERYGFGGNAPRSGPFAQHRIRLMPVGPGMTAVARGYYVIDGDEPSAGSHAKPELRVSDPRSKPEPVPPTTPSPNPVVVSYAQAISDWKKKHGAWRNAEAEKRAEQAKRRAADSLFAAVKTTDFGAITRDGLQAWKDGLSDPRQAYDYVSDVKSLYVRLDANNRLPGGNPCAKIETPLRPEHTPRAEFADDRARLIRGGLGNLDKGLSGFFA